MGVTHSGLILHRHRTMKNQILFLLLMFVITQAHSQRLGFSDFTAYGKSNTASDHSMYMNIGEPMMQKHMGGELNSCDGLLSSVQANAGNRNFIKVTYFLDDNENGIKDTDEIYLGIGAFTLQDSLLFRNGFKDGVSLLAPAGNYTISYEESGALGWFLTSPEEINVELDEDRPFAAVSFGLYTDESLLDVKTFICAAPFRCNTKVNYHMVALNQGYIKAAGTAWLKIDERLSDVQFVDEPDIVIDSNYVGWNYVLEPSQRQEFYYCLMAPGISDEVMLGDIYKSVCWTLDDELDPFCLNEVLRCSYDPNDKLVNPDRPDSLGLLRDEIVYTIRFQNTGNDYAEDVVVTDTISEFLDMSTFKLINTSHPKEFKIVTDRDNRHIINFTFDNIFLQDSTTNEPASHGFIMYTIRPKSEVEEWTEVNNTAHIYFDFNPPIVTNTTSTTLVEEFPTDAALELKDLGLTIAPNPTSGKLFLDKSVDKVKVFDLNGRLIAEHEQTKQINLNHLSEGTYLIDLYIGDTHQVQKIVVIH